MKLFTSLLFTLFITATSYAQQSKIESLKNALHTATHDSIRLSSIARIVNYYQASNYDSMLFYADKGLSIARKNKQSLHEGYFLSWQAFALRQKGEYAATLKSLLQAFEILQNPASEKNAYGLGNISPAEFRLNKLHFAHQTYGQLMEETVNTEQAIFHYKESERIASLIKDYFRIAAVSASIANQYLDAEQLDSVEVYAQKSVKVFEQINDGWKSVPILTLARKNFKAKNDKLGRKYLYQALQVATEYKETNRLNLLRVYQTLSSVHQNSGDKDSSLYYAKKAYEVASEPGLINTKLFKDGGVYEVLYKAYLLNNKMDSAFKYQGLTLTTRDAWNKEKYKNLAAFQSVLLSEATRLRELEKQQIETQSKIRTYAFLAVLAVLSIIGFILYRNNRQKRKANEVLNNTLTELKISQTQLELKNRDLEIEAALERVRSRSMAMRSSGELKDVITVVMEQFKILEFPVDLANFTLLTPSRNWSMWLATTNYTYPEIVHLSYLKHPLFDRPIDSLRKGLDFMSDVITKEEKVIILNHFFQTTDFGLGFEEGIRWLEHGKGIARSIAFMKNIALSIGNFDVIPYSEEQNAILKRFGSVFDQSYTRFLDLQKSEEQTKQAQLNLIQIQSEKKKAEDALIQLKATQTQLIQSEKLASLGELTAGIAHEIQNPLNFVNNFSEVSNELMDEMNEELNKGDIEEAKAISADIKSNLEKINHHGKRASDIVKGMLEHSRTSTGQKEATDINALCNDYLRLAYQGQKAKNKDFNVTMETHFDPNLPAVEIIPQDIGRVLLNLISNAFYAVSEKLKVESEKSNSDYEPKVTITTQLTANSQLLIAVKDNGSGIPDAIKDKIFQPFFTTKPTGQGTGLGLSLAYDIVKAYSGTLEVDSQEGNGSEFIIQMPI